MRLYQGDRQGQRAGFCVIGCKQTSQLLAVFTTVYSDRQRAGFCVTGCTENFKTACCFYHSVQRSTESRFLCHWLHRKLQNCLLFLPQCTAIDREQVSLSLAAQKTSKLLAVFTTVYSDRQRAGFLCHWLHRKLQNCLLFLPQCTAIDREQVSLSLAAQKTSKLLAVFTTVYSDRQRAGFCVIGCTENFKTACCFYHSVQESTETESRFLCHWLDNELHS